MKKQMSDQSLETIAELECIVSEISCLDGDQAQDFIMSRSIDVDLLRRYMAVKAATMKRFINGQRRS